MPAILRDILAAEQQQQADAARIDRAIRMAQAEIAFLETRYLDTEELNRRQSAIRERTVLAVRDVRQNMARRAVSAKAVQEQMTDEFLRRDPGFCNDYLIPHLHAFASMMERTRGSQSIAYIQKLISRGDVEGIRVALETHADSRIFAATFRELLTRLEGAGRAKVSERLSHICEAADAADASVRDLFFGSSHASETAHGQQPTSSAA